MKESSIKEASALIGLKAAKSRVIEKLEDLQEGHAIVMFKKDKSPGRDVHDFTFSSNSDDKLYAQAFDYIKDASIKVLKSEIYEINERMMAMGILIDE